MLGWISSIFELIGYIFGTIHAVFNYLVDFITYTIGFTVGMASFVNNLVLSIPWLAPLFAIATIWLTLAIVRLCVSLGGHSG